MLPDQLLVYLAIAAGCSLILGFRALAFSLAFPAIFRWLILPALWNYVPIPLLLLAAPTAAVFGGLLWLDRITRLVFGPRASGHMTGTYLVRIYDCLGRGILWLLKLPFQLLTRRRV